MQRFLLGIKDYSIYIDHYNHNRLDNRRKNLKVTTPDENARNRGKRNKNNKSGYRNVQWCTKRNKWVVMLYINGKGKFLGSFVDVHEAGKYAKKMRQKYYGEFAGVG